MPLDPARLLRARQRIRDYLHESDIDEEIVDQIVGAIEEAMTNAVSHSGAEEDLRLEMGFEGQDLVAQVADRGIGFDVSTFDKHRLPDVLKPGGRGLYIIGQLVDEFELRCDGGLEVRMRKRGVLPSADHREGTIELIDEASVVGKDYRATRQRAIVEEMTEAFATIDWEYRVTFGNKAALELFSLSSNEVRGRSLWELFPAIRTMPVGEAVQRAMELGISDIEEYHSPTVGLWVECRVYPSGSGVTLYLRDIDERKRRELERDELLEALRESEERFTAMFESSPFALALTKMPERTTVAANAAMRRLLGFDRDELVGFTTVDLGISDPASQDEVVSRLEADGVVRDFECRRTTKDGEHRWVSINIDPVTIHGEQHVLSTLQDITERKLAEEARSRFELLVANSRDIILFMESDGRIVDANQAAERAYGYGRDELIGMTVAGLRAEATLGEMPSQMTEADERGILFESLHRRRDGSLFPVEVSSRGATIGGRRTLVSIIRDISERREAEEAAKAKDEQWRHLTRYAPAGIYEIDFRGPRFVTVNDFMCAYSGYSREELLAKNPFDLLDGESQAHFQERIAKTLVGEAVDTTVEYGFITKRGEKRWTVLNVTPSFEDGKPIGAFVVGYDVTDRRRAEEALRDSEGLLRAVTDNSPDAVYVKDEESRWVMANPAVLRIVGRTAGEALGKTDRQLYDDPEIGEAILANDRRVMERSKAEVFEEVADTPQGRRTFISVKAPWRDAAGRTIGIVGISHDITERKRAEEALQATARLGEALTAINALVHSSLHADEIIQTALREGAQAIGAERAGLSLHEDESQRFRVAYVYNHPADKVGVLIPDSEDTHGVEAMRTGMTLAIDDTQTDPRVVRRLMDAWQIKSVICAPLVAQGKPIGVVYYSYCSAPHRFSEAEIDFMTKLASSLSTAVENATLYEALTGIATTLQRNFVHPLPEVVGWEFGTATQSASAAALVGGDFHDVFRVAPDNIAVLIGDVEGKGIAAAGLTETVRAATRALALSAPSPHFVLDRLNALLLHEGGRLVTAVFANISRVSGMLVVASAGHPAPLRLHRDGGVEQLSLTSTPPLGAFAESDFMVATEQINAGDALVLYTDGLTEARGGGRFFDTEGAIDALAGSAGLSAQEIAECLRDAVVEHADELRDDVHILVVRRP